MSEKSLQVGDALDHLVQQFADPLSCLRELVQNSLDAGSRQVDVRAEYDAGTLTLEVQDYGDGMDRAIIDGRLTRLFSSGKDGDLTKIGRFGIGFVSVFALAPDAVVLDTGRGGENWRVVFRRDRSFVLRALDTPVEGTCVRILKAVDPATAVDLRARAEQVLQYWCKHVDGEIYFDDVQINGPLAIEGAFVQQATAEGTVILAGLAEAPFGGFYNKGLTLLESHSDDLLPGVVFKVSSRYLEHTLTRDNVVHDAQYHRAMGSVRALVEGPVYDALLNAMTGFGPERALALPHFHRLLAAKVLPDARLQVPVFMGPGTHRWSVTDLLNVDPDQRWYATHDGAVPRAMVVQGHRVVIGDAADRALVDLACGHETADANAAFVLPAPAEASGGKAWARLTRRVRPLLEARGKVGALALAHFDYPGSSIAQRVVITQPSLGALTPVSELGTLNSGFFSRKRDVVVNADHPTVQQLLALVEPAPAFAAYALMKLFDLGRDDARLATDLALAQAAHPNGGSQSPV
jgi:hypothetical protein